MAGFARAAYALLGMGMLALASVPAHAGLGADLHHVHWSISAVGGATQLDDHLSDYRWDAHPRAAWGAQVAGEIGRVLGGARMLMLDTRQGTGIPGDATATTVRWTSLELLAGARLVSELGASLFVTASAGRVHLGYHPDQMEVTPLGGGTPIAVTFAAIDSWLASAGLLVRRPVTTHLALGLQIDRSYFALDTAHRVGASIQEQRETFGNWGARAEISWLLGSR